MFDLAYQPLTKRYTASVFSRSFCVPYLCYILTILIPATVLINLQYSWPQYTRVLITPILEYRAYELQCLDSSGVLYYSNNFKNQIADMDHSNFLSVAVDEERVYLNSQVYHSGLQACTFQIIFEARLGEAVKSLVQLPLNLYVGDSSVYLSSVSVMGSLSLASNSPLPQSSILTINQTSYSEQVTHTLHNRFRMSGKRNISLVYEPVYQKYENSASAADKVTLSGDFSILPKIYHRQATLLQKIRAFIPIFMFLTILLWKLVVNPLVEWMLGNRVYSAKMLHEKLKGQ